MGIEQENVRILRSAYETWDAKKAADIDCWISIIDDSARLTSLADGAAPLAFSRRRQGRSEIIEYLQDLIDTWEMIFYRVDEYIAQGDRVVALGSTSWRNKLTSKIATTPKIDVWRMRNGKVVEFSEFYDTAQLYAASSP
jgi:ketosteroid isomerase-like protein